MLERLQGAILAEQETITAALAQDFGKPPFETYTTEIALLLAELKSTLRHLRRWIKPRKGPASFFNFPVPRFYLPRAFGIALVIGAWNYPFQLTLAPVIGAIAAGCCAILNPSELTPPPAPSLPGCQPF